MNRTPLVENCCPLDATSIATGRAACSEPATRSTLSTLCSSYASTPVRAPMPKRQVESGAQGLRASSCTNHSPSSCTLNPDGPCASSTRTKRPARTSKDGSARRSSSASPRCTSSFSARVRSSSRSPPFAPSSPNGTSGSTPRHTLTPSPPLPPPAYRSKLASKCRCSSHSAGSSMTTERSCSGCASVSTSTPPRTAASLGVREYSAATPASGAPKSSARLVVALAADAEGETQRYSPLLVHCAATVRSRSPNRQSRSLNGWASAPSTRTGVSPAVAPLAGLRLATASGAWYTNGTSLRLYCCPFIVTSTLRTPAPSGWSGDVHVSLPAEMGVARTASAPNLHR